MTATSNETSVLDLLDFAVPCLRDECDRPAEWIAWLRGMPCCTPSSPLCSQCLAQDRVDLRAAGLLTCSDHGTLIASSQLSIDAEPINPRRTQ